MCSSDYCLLYDRFTYLSELFYIFSIFYTEIFLVFFFFCYISRNLISDLIMYYMNNIFLLEDTSCFGYMNRKCRAIQILKF